jgi:hypothetical protein
MIAINPQAEVTQRPHPPSQSPLCQEELLSYTCSVVTPAQP